MTEIQKHFTHVKCFYTCRDDSPDDRRGNLRPLRPERSVPTERRDYIPQ